MSKLSKLLIIGSGIAVANYYTKNSEKLEEHFNFIKKKAKDSYGYTRCMIRYAEKNGITEAADYLYKDAIKVAHRTKDKLTETYNDAVDYGKKLSNNACEIKEHASNIREYSAEFKENLGSAKKVAEEIKPNISNFVETAKQKVNSIKEKVEDIKEDLEADKVKEKIQTFSDNAERTIEEVKEKIETEVLKESTETENNEQ